MQNNKLTIIDPHCHFWDLSLGYNGWISDKESELLGSLKPLNQSYLPENYLADTKDFDLAKLVHIEAASSRFSKEEVDWVSGLSKQYPVIGAIVGGVDLLSRDAEWVLDYYTSNPLVKGIRQILNWHDEPKYTAADRSDDLTNPRWQQRYHLLKKYKLSFDMQICPTQMRAAAELAREFSDIVMIINHAGLPIEGEQTIWKAGIKQLAACPNVFIKLSGFGMLNHDWTVESIGPYVNTVIDMFGVERVMFASNFPVDKLYCGFSTMMNRYLKMVESASVSEKQRFFCENAQQIYRIG